MTNQNTASVELELTDRQSEQAKEVLNDVGNVVLTRDDLIKISERLYGSKYSLNWIRKIGEENRIARGQYVVPQPSGEIIIPENTEVADTAPMAKAAASSAPAAPQQPAVSYDNQQELTSGEQEVAPVADASVRNVETSSLKTTRPRVMGVDPNITYVPNRDKLYVPFGNHKRVKTILNAGLFYPVFVTGLSGNGKTTMLEQVCAELGRELFRVNITSETDEDDLLGGMRLVDGDTVFQYGPVVEAMKRGAVLLLDEVDLGGSKLMALQPVLEGKGVYLKKVNEFVQPAEGFTVVATANTKGKGSEDGSFAFTNVLNEAFLDRFPATMYQPYPSTAQEKKVLRKVLKSVNVVGDDAKDFINKLVQWAQGIRKLYAEGGCEEIITTRRLVNIGFAYSMFGDRTEAIKLCIERFDDESRYQFLDFYSKIDDSVSLEDEAGEQPV